MTPSIRKKLDALVERQEEVGLLLADPTVASDAARFRALSREYAQIEPITRLLAPAHPGAARPAGGTAVA
jgi:peptide chain release factor 1